MTIDDLGSMEPPSRSDDAAGPAARREQFRQANASLALEGMRVDAEDLAIQERICTGELSADEAVAFYLRRARKGGT